VLGAVAGATSRLLDDEGERDALVEETQLAVRLRGVSRVSVEAAFDELRCTSATCALL
jgi:hypothetical protein